MPESSVDLYGETMNEYEQINAGHCIDGYFIPHPGESKTAAFHRAKIEAVKNLQVQLANVESMSLEQFSAKGFQSDFK